MQPAQLDWRALLAWAVPLGGLTPVERELPIIKDYYRTKQQLAND